MTQPENTEANRNGSDPVKRDSVQQLRQDLQRLTRSARSDTDVEIIQLYLREMAGGTRPCSSNTIRNYRGVLMRFFAWYAAFHEGKPLSDFRREDVLDYQEFMADPPPDWISPKRVRDPKHKRPFTSALSSGEVERNSRILSKFFDYAVSQGRCVVNPWRQWSPQGLPDPRPNDQEERHLDAQMWEVLWSTVDAMQQQAWQDGTDIDQIRIGRTRWVLEALYIPALRVDELARSDAKQVSVTRRGRFLRIPKEIGKGRKLAAIPVPEFFLEELAAYRRLHGIRPEIPTRGDPWPLVLDLAGKRRITARQIHNIVVDAFREAADLLAEGGDTERSETIRRASSHWLRHSRATHLLDAGVSRKLVQDIMRHSKDATLDQYVHADDQAKQQASAAALEGLVRNPHF